MFAITRRYYDSPSRPSAAQVCDSLYKRGYPKWLVPAVITSKADAKVRSKGTACRCHLASSI